MYLNISIIDKCSSIYTIKVSQNKWWWGNALQVNRCGIDTQCSQFFQCKCVWVWNWRVLHRFIQWKKEKKREWKKKKKTIEVWTIDFLSYGECSLMRHMQVLECLIRNNRQFTRAQQSTSSISTTPNKYKIFLLLCVRIYVYKSRERKSDRKKDEWWKKPTENREENEVKIPSKLWHIQT